MISNIFFIFSFKNEMARRKNVSKNIIASDKEELVKLELSFQRKQKIQSLFILTFDILFLFYYYFIYNMKN